MLIIPNINLPSSVEAVNKKADRGEPACLGKKEYIIERISDEDSCSLLLT